MTTHELHTAALATLAALLLCASGPAPARSGEAAPAASCGEPDLEANKRVARLVFEEVLSRGRIAENEAIYHPDFVAHGLTRDAGRDEDRAASEGWRQAAPDLKMTVLQIVAECDQVAVHWEGTGTNTGSGNGLPATGKSLRVRGMTFFRIAGGQILEEWTAFDQYALLKQLGLLGG